LNHLPNTLKLPYEKIYNYPASRKTATTGSSKPNWSRIVCKQINSKLLICY